MYGKSGKIDDARRVLDDMICRDSVSWNSLIAGYFENGFVDQAIVLFKHMRDFLHLLCWLKISISNRSPTILVFAYFSSKPKEQKENMKQTLRKQAWGAVWFTRPRR
ncbi:hypothetical protein Ddye_022633 [Dipteronia dyeriana]|uniref:Pentatricopeptide repeat-containing protein n=1 Tax=Dipteronia dyeriana TaxID=168575 RepID=A0AAD9TSC6_9ROSI|nr:hypothetical protein Ddye_022633 [Dipteronia dyeriana]